MSNQPAFWTPSTTVGQKSRRMTSSTRRAFP
jgi:hypothetical protein